jgi:hypothetical protein
VELVGNINGKILVPDEYTVIILCSLSLSQTSHFLIKITAPYLHMT